MKELLSKGQKKEIAVYTVLMAAAIGLSVLYTVNHRMSIVNVMLKLLKIKE